MYKVFSAQEFSTNDDGTRTMHVILVSDEDPDTLPTKGSDVGMEANVIFAPMSMLVVPSAGKMYLHDGEKFYPF
jgi:hypothetical protein